MRKKDRVELILQRLHELYPQTECTLDIDDNVFHLVVRAVLSAQCTDVRVNEVMFMLKIILCPTNFLMTFDLFMK